jgi:hypothetical protein
VSEQRGSAFFGAKIRKLLVSLTSLMPLLFFCFPLGDAFQGNDMLVSRLAMDELQVTRKFLLGWTQTTACFAFELFVCLIYCFCLGQSPWSERLQPLEPPILLWL